MSRHVHKCVWICSRNNLQCVYGAYSWPRALLFTHKKRRTRVCIKRQITRSKRNRACCYTRVIWIRFGRDKREPSARGILAPGRISRVMFISGRPNTTRVYEYGEIGRFTLWLWRVRKTPYERDLKHVVFVVTKKRAIYIYFDRTWERASVSIEIKYG